jgi:hypothetical protein
MFRWFILPELAVTAGDIYQFGAELTQDEAICFEVLKFITNPSDDQSLLPEGSDPCAVFMVMARSGSPSLYTILEELPNEDNSTSSDTESSNFLVPRECNVVASAILIATMTPSEETLTLQITPVVPQ